LTSLTFAHFLLAESEAPYSAMFLVLWSVLVMAHAAVCTHTTELEYNITWVNRNPDGLHNRPVIGINGEWPIPALHVTKGEYLAITVRNNLGNETTSLHWHGLYMDGAAHMDGPPGVTQCEIPSGESFVYEFQVSCKAR
jgi:iron transport multicopper oxidase